MAKAPYGHWNTMTFLAGLRCNGVIAPLVLDGPINGVIFAAWIEQALVPALKPGNVVILDNLFRRVSLLKRPGFAGGSTFQIGWSHDEQDDDEQIFT